MTPAFLTGPTLPLSRARVARSTCSPRKSNAPYVTAQAEGASENGAGSLPKVFGEPGAMTPANGTATTLFDYTTEDTFVPDKPVPPSAISWPSGDGRGKECKGTKGSFNQPNLKLYGPFPDFFKVG